MKQRFVSFALVLLCACSSGENSHEPSAGKTASVQHEMVFCALAGAAEFTGDCTQERGMANGRPVVIVRHPDGGFRRFAIDSNRAGLITADGADHAGVAANGNLLDVRVGEDRYRFPLEGRSHAAVR